MSIYSPTVSVIIPTSHNLKHLPNTVNSVLQQTCSDLELLIVDNGSCDRHIEWLRRLKDPRLKFISFRELSLAQTFNLGITKAKGQYIAFLDAHDLWHPDKLQKQVLCLERYPAIGLVHSWLRFIDHRGKLIGKVVRHNLAGWVEQKILERNQIALPSVVVRRQCFNTVGLFDPELPTTHDWDMWIRLSRYYQFMAIAEPLVYYRHNQNRINRGTLVSAGSVVSYAQRCNGDQNWLIVERNFQTTIEKAYVDIPMELLYLKDRSYANASLDLACQVINSQNFDSVVANNYCRQALEHSLRIGFSPEFLRIRLAITMLHYLKRDRYHQLLFWLQTIQRWVMPIVEKFRRSTQSLLN